MAVIGLYSAATGMKAMDTQLDVIANNLANSNTTAFKEQRVNFEDLFYEERRQPGALNTLGESTSSGLFVGLGTRVSNTQLNMGTGAMLETGNPLDVAISGRGFFKVTTYDGVGGGEAYARAGNFATNSEGSLVLGTADGPLVEPEITFPDGTDFSTVTMTSDGQISAMVDGSNTTIGQLQLYRFPNPYGLRLEGGNLYTETEASGSPTQGNPTDAGYGSVTNRYLEGSNVDPVRELVNMIRTQRSFELNSQTIKAVDSNMQVVSRLRS